MNKKIVTIGGRQYDALTGLALDETNQSRPPISDVKPSVIHHSQKIHHSLQKSQTLNRKVVKKEPAYQHKVTHHGQHRITRFAPITPVAQSTQIHHNVANIAPQPHPLVQHAHRKMDISTKQIHPITPKSAQVIKQEAIHQALNQPSVLHTAVTKNHTKRSKGPRFASLASAGFALLLLGGYFTYINMPNLSVRVAAVQAGINASYPSYKPDGYSLAGPVAYNDGEVELKFASNAGPQKFTITQMRSTWDSTAVKENYINSAWGGDYTTFAEHGLTVYIHDSDAVWVNGGIRYTISGDAPLSSSQIRSIASSL
jgi:hypothetical protein